MKERASPTSVAGLLARAFGAISHAAMVTDTRPAIVAVNPAFTRITGWRDEDVIGENPRILNSGRQAEQFYADMWRALATSGSWAGEIWNCRKNGDVYPEWLTIDAIRDAAGSIEFYVAVFADITGRKLAEQNLQQLAYHDPLTSLPNRLAFAANLERTFALAQRKQRTLSVLVIDLDGFKVVNDAFGHDVGDLLLVSVAQRLASCVRATDTVARTGGDEFLVLCPEPDDPEAAALVAERIVAAIGEPFLLRGQSVTVGASVGIGFYPGDGTDAATIVKAADEGMYAAKRASGGDARRYGPTRGAWARGGPSAATCRSLP